MVCYNMLLSELNLLIVFWATFSAFSDATPLQVLWSMLMQGVVSLVFKTLCQMGFTMSMASTPQEAYYERPENADAAHNLDEKEAEADIEHQLGWNLVFRQVERPWPKSAGETFHAWDSTSLLYSTMDADEMERFRDADGYFTFRLVWPLPGHKHGKDPVDPAAPQNVAPALAAAAAGEDRRRLRAAWQDVVPRRLRRPPRLEIERNYLAHGTVRGYTAPPVAELSKTKGSSKGVGIDPSPFDSIAENGDPPKGRRVALFKIGQRNLDRHGGLTAWSAEQEGSVGSVELYVLNPIRSCRSEGGGGGGCGAFGFFVWQSGAADRGAEGDHGEHGHRRALGDADALLRPAAQEASVARPLRRQARPPQAREEARVGDQSVHKKLARAAALVTAQFNYADDILAKANNDPATPWRRRLSSMAASHTSGQQLAACSTTQTSTLSSIDTDLPGAKSRNWWRTVKLPADAMLVQPGGGMIGFFIREHADGTGDGGGGVGATKLDLATSGGGETPAALSQKASSGSLRRRSVAVAGGSKVTRYVPVIRILTTPHELTPRGRWPFWNGRGWERSKHAELRGDVRRATRPRRGGRRRRRGRRAARARGVAGGAPASRPRAAGRAVVRADGARPHGGGAGDV